MDTLPTTRPDPQVLAHRGEGEVGGTGRPTGDLSFEPANLPPPDMGELGQPEGMSRDQFEHDDNCSPHTTPTLQNLGAKVVGAEEPGGDSTLKPVLADQELGLPAHERNPEQNISCLQKPIGGGTPGLSPAFGDDPPTMNLMRRDILPTNSSDPQALATRGKGEGNETEEPRGDSPQSTTRRLRTRLP